MKVSVLKKFILLFGFLLLSNCEQQIKSAEDYYSAHDYKKAYQLFLKRAEAGEAVAQHYLGTIHYLGLIERRDLNKARMWFEKAAKQKLASAQLNLAMIIEQQAEQAAEFLESYKWYYAAHENGNQEAEKRIKHLLEHHRIFHNQRTYAQKEMVPYIDFKQDKKRETTRY